MLNHLSPQQWRQIFDLLDTALELPAPAREPWLATLGGENAQLRGTLRELLARQARGERLDFLGVLPQFTHVANSPAGAREHSAVAGGMVGPYRLVEELGRGGMSTVWTAERVDGLLKRRIALKLPYLSWALPDLAERMSRERDILAALEHPNIARLYDAGVADDGRPYLALELIAGQPIDAFCAERKLDLTARLKLVVQIARAVSYAHSRLIVHRDLKPCNILVDVQGQAHLLDFGIGKLLDPTPLDAGAAPTQFGGRAFTPEYASPEQMRGEAITTSTDIYSLGVILFRLLTGQRPYVVGKEPMALDYAVMNTEPRLPSLVADDPERQRALRGDLDTIVMKALKKAPAERYATMDAFAGDVERYLGREPVLARPDSAWYRLRKFAARNRVAVVSAATGVLALAAGLILATWQLHIARAEARRAQDVKEFVESIFRSADPYFTGKQSMSAADLLTLARQRIDRELGEQPQNAVELLTVVGESQLNLEQREAARATLEEAIRRGTAALGPNHLYVAQARMRLAVFYVNERDYEPAKELLTQALPILRQHEGQAARDLAEGLQVRGFIAGDQGNMDAAIADTRAALAILRKHLGENDSETILDTRHLAQQLIIAGQLQEGLQLAEEAYRRARALFPAGESNGLLVETEDVYGRALGESGQLDEGIAHLKAAARDAAELFGPSNSSVMAKLNYLARAQGKAGDLKGMIESAQRTVDAASNDQDRARARFNLGNDYLLARDIPRALDLLSQALAELRRVDSGPGSWAPAAAAEYAAALAFAGRFTEAERLLQENVAISKDLEARDLATTYNGLGLVQTFSGHVAQSERWYRDALALLNAGNPPSRGRAGALHGLGMAQLESGRLAEAEKTLRETDRMFRALYRKPIPTQAEALVSLGRAVLAQGRTAEALPILAQANSTWVEYAHNRGAGEAAYWYARGLLAAGETQPAKQALQRAVPILKASPLPADAALYADAQKLLR